MIGDRDSSEFDAVYSDDVQGAFELTSHLIADSYREIWFIGDIELPCYARCAEGYRRSMVQAGLQPRMNEIHSEDQQLGYLAMRSIISRGEPFTAGFAGSDQIAGGVTMLCTSWAFPFLTTSVLPVSTIDTGWHGSTPA